MSEFLATASSIEAILFAAAELANLLSPAQRFADLGIPLTFVQAR